MTNANSEDPDQTAPEGAVWSGSAQFAITLCILRNNCIKSKKLHWNEQDKLQILYIKIARPGNVSKINKIDP